MSDLINRQAALDGKIPMQLANGVEIYSDEAVPVEYLKRLPSAEPYWIPCNERLPEDGTYIVYAPEYRGGSSRSKEHHDGVMFASFKNGKWSIEHGYYSRPNCVIAWMPLPEPYEVEDE